MGRWINSDSRPVYAPQTPRIRHVWVKPHGGHGPPGAGLVLAWRMERQPSSLATGWSAQVAVVWTPDRLSIEWVSAENLQPAVSPNDVPADL